MPILRKRATQRQSIHGATQARSRPAHPWSRITAAARERFNVTRFRLGQRELIEAVLAGQDAIGVLPTGAGKSLCYQLPALFLRGTVIVVSPLIALLQDQKEHLEAADIGEVIRAEEEQVVVAFVRHGERRMLASRLRLTDR